MEDSTYWKTVSESLKSFWKPGQKLTVTGPFQATGDEGICCMLCHWPLTSNQPIGAGLREVYLLTNINTGHSITVGGKCKEGYKKMVAEMEKPVLKGKVIKQSWEHYPFDPYDEIPDLEEEKQERFMDDETYSYYFSDDEWVADQEDR